MDKTDQKNREMDGGIWYKNVDGFSGNDPPHNGRVE